MGKPKIAYEIDVFAECFYDMAGEIIGLVRSKDFEKRSIIVNAHSQYLTWSQLNAFTSGLNMTGVQPSDSDLDEFLQAFIRGWLDNYMKLG